VALPLQGRAAGLSPAPLFCGFASRAKGAYCANGSTSFSAAVTHCKRARPHMVQTPLFGAKFALWRRLYRGQGMYAQQHIPARIKRKLSGAFYAPSGVYPSLRGVSDASKL